MKRHFTVLAGIVCALVAVAAVPILSVGHDSWRAVFATAVALAIAAVILTRVTRNVATFALLIIALGASSFAMTGCEDSQAKKAADGCAKIATSLSALEQANEAAAKDGLLTADETIRVSELVRDATNVNDQFAAQVRTAIKSGNTISAQEIAALFASVTTSVDKLNSEGVLKIKNPEAQQRLQAALTIVQAAAATVEAIIGSSGASVASPAGASAHLVNSAYKRTTQWFGYRPPVQYALRS